MLDATVMLARSVTEFLEDPKFVIGVPLLAIGALGALVALSPVELLKVRAPSEPEPAAVEEVPVEEVPEEGHVSPATYIKVGLILAVITAVEVAFFYLDLAEGALIGILLALSIMKFVLVALWFMHLQFDNRVFSMFFAGGIALAIILFIVVLSTLGSSLV